MAGDLHVSFGLHPPLQRYENRRVIARPALLPSVIFHPFQSPLGIKSVMTLTFPFLDSLANWSLSHPSDISEIHDFIHSSFDHPIRHTLITFPSMTDRGQHVIDFEVFTSDFAFVE
jgi:hypothetical protein